MSDEKMRPEEILQHYAFWEQGNEKGSSRYLNPIALQAAAELVASVFREEPLDSTASPAQQMYEAAQGRERRKSYAQAEVRKLVDELIEERHKNDYQASALADQKRELIRLSSLQAAANELQAILAYFDAWTECPTHTTGANSLSRLVRAVNSMREDAEHVFEAAEDFCLKVESGCCRSVDSYGKFKAALIAAGRRKP